jgi:hypothetical protein
MEWICHQPSGGSLRLKLMQLTDTEQGDHEHEFTNAVASRSNPWLSTHGSEWCDGVKAVGGGWVHDCRRGDDRAHGAEVHKSQGLHGSQLESMIPRGSSCGSACGARLQAYDS